MSRLLDILTKGIIEQPSLGAVSKGALTFPLGNGIKPVVDRTLGLERVDLSPDDPEHGLCHVFGKELTHASGAIPCNLQMICIKQCLKDHLAIRHIRAEPFPVNNLLLPEPSKSDTHLVRTFAPLS